MATKGAVFTKTQMIEMAQFLAELTVNGIAFKINTDPYHETWEVIITGF